jgi:hypothetical protein
MTRPYGLLWLSVIDVWSPVVQQNPTLTTNRWPVVDAIDGVVQLAEGSLEQFVSCTTAIAACAGHAASRTRSTTAPRSLIA